VKRDATAALLAALGLLVGSAAGAAPTRILLQELPASQRGEISRSVEALVVEALDEVKLKGERRETEVSSPPGSAGAAKAADRLAVIAFRNLRGRVATIDAQGVAIDLGHAQGVQKGMEFAVYHEGAWIGLIRAEQVSASGAVCAPVAGKRTGEGAAAVWGFAPGDEVRQREDALGAGLADEAEARARILGWQREQDGFERERRAFNERGAKIELGLRTSPDVRASLVHLKELTALGTEVRAWRLRYSAWIDKVLKEQEARLAGNPHLAAYRRSLAEGTAIDAEEERWQEVRVGLIRGVFVQYEKIDEIVKSTDEDLKADAKTWARGRPAWEDHVKKRYEVAQDAIDKKDDQINEHSFALDELLGDSERWEAQDRVFLARRAARRDRLVDGLLNRARVALLQGLDLRAARLYRQALALEPMGPSLRAARAGLELSRLRLVLAGESSDERSGFAPPLEVAWKSAAPGELRGGIEIAAGLAVGTFADPDDPERTVVRALRLDAGELAWEALFPGRPGGPALVAEGEVIVASDRGVLYRFRAADGEALAEFDLGVSIGKVGSRILRVGARVIWLATVGVAGAANRDLLARIDLEQPANSRLDAVRGRLIDAQPAAGELLLVAADGLPGDPERAAAVPDGLELALPLIARTGTRPRPPDTTVTALLGGQRPGAGDARLWSIAGVTVQWLGAAPEHLVASVVTVPSRDGVDPVSHVLFLGIGASRGVNWRISLPKRDAVADMVVEGNRAYLLLRDGWLLAVNLKKREVLWTVDLPVASSGGFRWARFLAVGEDDLVFWCGSVEPPWTVYAVSKEGLVSAETTIPRGARALPLWRDGFLYSAERDGSLVARHPARDGQLWRFSPVAAEDFFGPRPPEDIAGRVARETAGLPWDERQRQTWEAAFVPGRAAGRQPLAFAGDRLVFWSSRDRHLYALVPAGGRR
jgi:outer membrane protein assembly factor BamB